MAHNYVNIYTDSIQCQNQRWKEHIKNCRVKEVENKNSVMKIQANIQWP